MYDPAAKRLFIFEIKRRWCVEGWWQLARLYAPVGRAIYGPRDVVCTCICGSADIAGVATPRRPVLFSDLSAALRPDRATRWRDGGIAEGGPAPDGQAAGEEREEVGIVICKPPPLQRRSRLGS